MTPARALMTLAALGVAAAALTGCSTTQSIPAGSVGGASAASQAPSQAPSSLPTEQASPTGTPSSPAGTPGVNDGGFSADGSGWDGAFTDVKTPEYRGSDPRPYQFAKGALASIANAAQSGGDSIYLTPEANKVAIDATSGAWTGGGAPRDAVRAYLLNSFDCDQLDSAAIAATTCVTGLEVSTDADNRVRIRGVLNTSQDPMVTGDYSTQPYTFELAISLEKSDKTGLVITNLEGISFGKGRR